MFFEEGNEEQEGQNAEEEQLVFDQSEPSNHKQIESFKDSVVMLIDARQSMVKSEVLSKVLSGCRDFIKEKIWANESDLVSIIFYGTSKSQNELDSQGVYVLYKLDQPDADLIKALERLLNMQIFQNEIGSSQKEIPLSDALWVARDMFKDRKGIRRIFLFTNEDSPCHEDQNALRNTWTQAKDCINVGITIELFPFDNEEKKFDPTRFYSQILTVDEEELMQGGIEKLEELSSFMRKKEFKKRTLGRIKLDITENTSISFKIYCTLRQATKPSPITLHAETLEPTACVTLWMCKETGNQLSEGQIANCVTYGGKKLPFEKSEMKQVKKFANSGMKLMGFKAKSKIKCYYNIRPAYFLYPDDEWVTGSANFADALARKIEDRQKVAIVRVQPRETSLLKFGALYPKFTSDNKVIGFNLIFLPFADDIRDPASLLSNQDQVIKPTNEQIKAAKAMIDRIRLPNFNCSDFFNPGLQHFYHTLEDIALEQTTESPIDTLMPDTNFIDQQSEFIKQFAESVWNEEQSEEENNKKTAKKRGAAKEQNKKSKNEGFNREEIEKLVKNDALDKKKANELKEMCKTLGLKAGGRKDDLIQRITDFFN